MSDKLDELMYKSGLTAQGCWDEMDQYNREAIIRFGNEIIAHCIGVLKGNEFYAKKYKWTVSELANASAYEIERTFLGDDYGKETVSS
jgi:hypothetical protein